MRRRDRPDVNVVGMRSLVSSLVLGALLACAAQPNRRVDPANLERRAGAAPVASASAEPAPSAVPARSSAAEEPHGAGPAAVVARVAGDPIPAGELLALWLHRESPRVRGYLEEIVLSRLVLAEAQRLGVRLPDGDLDRAAEEALGRVAERGRREAPSLTLDDYLRQRLGLDAATFRARLRREREIDLLAERCVRAWLLESERAEVRVLVAEERQVIETARARLSRGEDFSALAEELSVESSAADGGRIPPVVRGESALSRLAFSTPLGDIGGPVFEGGRYLLVKVDALPRPTRGPWVERGPLVEASLAEHGIEDPEYWQWKAAMIERYEVDMEPFLELVGEPLVEPVDEGAGTDAGDPAPGG